jgi:hypothetical protein
MPRRERPAETTRSEHWLREAVNRFPTYLNQRVGAALSLPNSEGIQWLSPTKDDEYAEYFDQAFLDLLDLRQLRVPLQAFWPAGGSRWDGLELLTVDEATKRLQKAARAAFAAEEKLVTILNKREGLLK